MIMQIVWLLCGLGLLLYAGDALVRGAVAAALKMGLSPLIAGIVVIGFGTSLPEVLVSLDAAFSDAEDLAHGNIVGSNIANIMLVLGFTAIFAPVATNAVGTGRSMFVTFAATFIWIGVTYYMGLNPMIGAAFLTALIVYIAYLVISSRKQVGISGVHHDEIPEEVDEEDKDLPIWKVCVFLLIGLLGLALGARLTINAGVFIAKELGVSEAIIGLTLLAVGTSLPEIGASVAAAMRKHTDVVFGNVLGSNLFNLFAAGGAISLVKTQTLGPSFHVYSHWVMAAATIAIAIFVAFKLKIGRLVGLVLLLIYGAYIFGLVNDFSFMEMPNLIVEPEQSEIITQ
ncbi:calcium/sodium antiporter [Hirschia maritima]|uniref:calcium/sodium antiporter n=1 Tax=Hirschia maritima TaxID=1121961 RepID=UPI0003631377|nr:calcium/sodium antiporter [Hirschia maritima]